MKGLRRLADANDLMLVLDEVQSGYAWTGRMFAYEHYGIEPDILAWPRASAAASRWAPASPPKALRPAW